MAHITHFNFHLHYHFIFVWILLSLICILHSPLDGCEVCGRFSHAEVTELESIEVEPEKLGEFEELFKEFQKSIENPDINSREFFVWRWCKKAKKWFVKRMYHLFKEIIGIKSHKGNISKDYCAYMVAKFQRDVDKYHNTGHIRNTIQKMRDHYENDDRINEKMHPFFKRIKHYVKHKKDRSKHPDHNRYDFMRRGSSYENENLLEGVPLKCAFGGVEMGCGVLVALIPFPGCRYLGGAMILQGGQMIYEGFVESYDTLNKRGKDANTTSESRRRFTARDYKGFLGLRTTSSIARRSDYLCTGAA